MSTIGDHSLQARRVRRRETPSRGDQQEHAILDATEQLLHEHRFADLTVAKVAHAAGISRPAVYFYFGSMEELLVALVSRAVAALIESIESVEVEPDATPRGVLAAGIQRTSRGWRSHGAVLRTALDHAHGVPGVYAQWRLLLDRGIDLYVALITWAADLTGRPRPDEADSRRHAELCMLMVGCAFHELHETPHDTTDEQRLEHDLLVLVGRALELGG